MPKLPPFKDSLLLTRALTHRSYFNEHPEEVEDNERLEFLGDAVLGFLIGELLYRHYPKMSEGKLTALRARLVSEKQLATLANDLHIGDQMRLGKGTLLEGGRQNSSLLSDTFEAIIGAYFLDSGIDKVRKFVEALFMPIADSIVFAQSDINFKSRFQEWALANIGKNPEYSNIAESGPDHAKIFTVRVRVGGKVYGEGMGRSKQAAEKNAAEDALRKVELM